jgi:hypothetical protein
MAKKQTEHYVNNKEFSAAVVDYVRLMKKARAEGKEEPRASNYIGDCILKICKGLSHKPNFSGYSYVDEMVMDAVENCIEKLLKFDRDLFEEKKSKVTKKFKDGLSEEDLDAFAKANGFKLKSVNRWYGEWLSGGDESTKPQLPNAFSYFTQIAFYAFLRRIAKEKKQSEIKQKIIDTAGISSFADFDMSDAEHSAESLISKMRTKRDAYNRDDSQLFDEDKPIKKKSNRGWKAKAAKTTCNLFED